MFVFIDLYTYHVADHLFRNAINQTDDFNSTLSDLDSAVGSWRSRYVARQISFKIATSLMRRTPLTHKIRLVCKKNLFSVN